MKATKLSLLFFIVCSLHLQLFAQERTIRGTVTDKETGETLIGVNVFCVEDPAGGTTTDLDGKYTLPIPVEAQSLKFTYIGYNEVVKKLGESDTLDVQMNTADITLDEVVLSASRVTSRKRDRSKNKRISGKKNRVKQQTAPVSKPRPPASSSVPPLQKEVQELERKSRTGELGKDEGRNMQEKVNGLGAIHNDPVHNTENYNHIEENDFVKVSDDPQSTFSIDVDAAAYANSRRYLKNGGLPPPEAVRIEEFINYFDYDYPQPKDEHPLAIITEVGECPWNADNYLLHIGLQGKEVNMKKAPASNLVFLIDVSGSMNSHDKLPLLKKGFEMLTRQLRSKDRVAIVVYAGAAGLVLESTPGNKTNEILAAINRLNAGGSTAGGAGIKLAYQVAQDNFIENGNNRVILATDGDFNVGVSSDGAMVRLVEEKRETGVFLSVLGFGTGNLKDSKMEQMANKGNGNYNYIDSELEARKVLVNEMGGTLLTIAKDVKLQLEFNPLKVASYRLIGYENRMLENWEFDDDTKDAGELGAGHTVTALYEIVPNKSPASQQEGDKLKYQDRQPNAQALRSGELLTVKFRYKPPKSDKSILMEHPVKEELVADYSENFTFSAAVASFGMLLRGSKYAGQANYKSVLALATQGRGKDKNGYRKEFADLVKKAKKLRP